MPPGGLAERRGISAHFQSVIRHFGGQVDVLDEPMQTRSNLAAGIEYHFLPELNMLNRVTLSSYYMLALELSPTNTIQYDKGFALHNTLGFENKWVKLNAGWFHGKTFFAPMGDYLFQSISELDSSYTCDIRNLITSKFLFSQQIIRGINMGARFEAYYDLPRHALDYSYGLNISVNASFLRKKSNTKPSDMAFVSRTESYRNLPCINNCTST